MPGPNQEPEKKKELHQLSDVEVLTVGLVSHGANREDFFIRKEAEMADEELLLEKEEPQGDENKGLLAKLRKLARSEAEAVVAEKADLHPKAKECMLKACKELQKGTDVLPPEVKKMVDRMTAMAGKPPEDEAEGYGYPEPGKAPAKKSEEPEPTPEPTPEPAPEVVKAAVATIPPEFAARMAQLEKSQGELQAELQKARDAEFRGNFVQKAAELGGASVPQGELVDQLVFLAKADPARADWWLTTLKALDHQLTDAGIFAEKGTTRIDDQDPAEVAKSGEDPRAALLKISGTRAEEYLNERRVQIRTGRR